MINRRLDCLDRCGYLNAKFYIIPKVQSLPPATVTMLAIQALVGDECEIVASSESHVYTNVSLPVQEVYSNEPTGSAQAGPCLSEVLNSLVRLVLACQEISTMFSVKIKSRWGMGTKEYRYSKRNKERD